MRRERRKAAVAVMYTGGLAFVRAVTGHAANTFTDLSPVVDTNGQSGCELQVVQAYTLSVSSENSNTAVRFSAASSA